MEHTINHLFCNLLENSLAEVQHQRNMRIIYNLYAIFFKYEAYELYMMRISNRYIVL